MALIKCKDCGNQISKKAKSCPQCGAPVKRKSLIMRLFGITVLVVLTTVFFISRGEVDTRSRDPNQAARQDKPAHDTRRDIIETRMCRKEVLTDIAVKDPDGNIITTEKGLEEKLQRTGPGMEYSCDNSGPLFEKDKLYVLEEKDGWIRFRVTLEDVGWSAWLQKDLTVSVAEIRAERVARFGEPPYSSAWDRSVSCVERYLRMAAKDPDSLVFENWSEVFYSEDGWVVRCDYRAKNSFGGYERAANWFVIRQGRVVEVKDANAYE